MDFATLFTVGESLAHSAYAFLGLNLCSASFLNNCKSSGYSSSTSPRADLSHSRPFALRDCVATTHRNNEKAWPILRWTDIPFHLPVEGNPNSFPVISDVLARFLTYPRWLCYQEEGRNDLVKSPSRSQGFFESGLFRILKLLQPSLRKGVPHDLRTAAKSQFFR